MHNRFYPIGIEPNNFGTFFDFGDDNSDTKGGGSRKQRNTEGNAKDCEDNGYDDDNNIDKGHDIIIDDTRQWNSLKRAQSCPLCSAQPSGGDHVCTYRRCVQ
eukprot:gene12258-biopygen4755